MKGPGNRPEFVTRARRTRRAGPSGRTGEHVQRSVDPAYELVNGYVSDSAEITVRDRKLKLIVVTLSHAGVLLIPRAIAFCSKAPLGNN